MRTVDTGTDAHDEHEIETLERIYDNPIEYSHWMYCHTCSEQFIHCGTEIVFDDEREEFMNEMKEMDY